eukprot:scaffold7074_cov256-Pinguiococcus_pyrenoidosus.AAC.10
MHDTPLWKAETVDSTISCSKERWQHELIAARNFLAKSRRQHLQGILEAVRQLCPRCAGLRIQRALSQP